MGSDGRKALLFIGTAILAIVSIMALCKLADDDEPAHKPTPASTAKPRR